MARAINRLSARTAASIGPGFHADGNGLYLKVEATGARRWVFVFFEHNRRREMGMGPLADIPLAKARQMVAEARSKVQAGVNPIFDRQAVRTAVKALPFGELADQVVDDKAPQWSNPKVAAQWKTTLTIDAKKLRRIPVDQITTENVLEVLQPIWLEKPETAARLRGRIELVLDVAKARGMRKGENPARWKGHLSLMLPKRHAGSRRNHPWLHYDRLADFMPALRKSESVSAVALDFTILTVARTNETLGAKGTEFDLDAGIWTVPPERMKSKRPHRIPLSKPAMAIARQRIKVCGDGYLFPGLVRGKPLSNMAMLRMLDIMGYGDVTVHGFRATFKSYCYDKTNFPREIIEAALAHLIGDEAEQAYLRTDALERRRQLMDVWAEFCEGKGAKILKLRA